MVFGVRAVCPLDVHRCWIHHFYTSANATLIFENDSFEGLQSPYMPKLKDTRSLTPSNMTARDRIILTIAAFVTRSCLAVLSADPFRTPLTYHW